MENRNQIKKQMKSNLTIFFYLTHVKREEIGPMIQFLQKFNLSLRRIKNEKEKRASNYLRQNSNFMAQSSKPISFEEFQIISQFFSAGTNVQAIVVGYEYENAFWNVSRTKMHLGTPADLTWSLFNRVIF